MKSELIHAGQYKRYGDTFRVWKITTDGENEEEVLKYIKENVFNIFAFGSYIFSVLLSILILNNLLKKSYRE